MNDVTPKEAIENQTVVLERIRLAKLKYGTHRGNTLDLSALDELLENEKNNR